jgi:hypothetical protein
MRKKSRQGKARSLIYKIAKRMRKELGKDVGDLFETRDAYQEKFGVRSLTKRFDFCSIIM